MRIARAQLELISRVYDAALDQTAWVGALDDVAKQCDADEATLIGLADMNNSDMQIQSGNSLYSKDFLDDYKRRFPENVASMRKLGRFPAYRMFRDTEILYDEEVPARERPTLKFLYER
ncbi:MAG: hypothetical protein IIC09_04285, partial [Proteobacteria bacterium]|nr:hypothetical protein [Pseudomonadota bacterium]